MSGGSKKKSGVASAPAATTEEQSFSEYGNMPVVTTVDPFMGNNQEMLAAQIAAGYGGTPQEYIDQSAAIYQPTTSMGLFEPLTETKAALKDGKFNLKGTTGLLSLDRLLSITPPDGAASANSTSSGGGSSSSHGPGSGLYDVNGFINTR